MPTDKLIDPVGIEGWMFWLAVGLLVLILAWIVYRIWFHRRDVTRIVMAEIDQDDRERWIEQLYEVAAKYAEADPRLAYLALAAELRSIISERASVDVTAWSPRELARYEQIVSTAALIASWERPSFAREADTDVSDAAARAIREVREW